MIRLQHCYSGGAQSSPAYFAKNVRLIHVHTYVPHDPPQLWTSMGGTARLTKSRRFRHTIDFWSHCIRLMESFQL